jgi:hypothetical protein
VLSSTETLDRSRDEAGSQDSAQADILTRIHNLPPDEQARILEDLKFLQFLKDECGYMEPRPLGDGRWAGLAEMMFTVGIIIGNMGDRVGVIGRYCYTGESDQPILNKLEAYAKAKAALEAWDPKTQDRPDGWIRDKVNGFTRPGGDPSKEYREA